MCGMQWLAFDYNWEDLASNEMTGKLITVGALRLRLVT